VAAIGAQTEVLLRQEELLKRLCDNQAPLSAIVSPPVVAEAITDQANKVMAQARLVKELSQQLNNLADSFSTTVEANEDMELGDGMVVDAETVKTGDDDAGKKVEVAGEKNGEMVVTN
jgi:hypothetical protein